MKTGANGSCSSPSLDNSEAWSIWCGVRGAAVAMIVSSAIVSGGAVYALHTRVAAVRPSGGAIFSLFATAAALMYLAIAPTEYRMAATAIAILSLAAVVSWYQRVIRADVARVRGAFAASSRAMA